MQFIVKPTSTSPSVVCKKFFRFHSTVVLITIGSLVLFSTGFMFSLLWNMDGLCSSRLKSAIETEADSEIAAQEAGPLRNDNTEGIAVGGGDNLGKELTDVGLANGLIHLSSHSSSSHKQEVDLLILIMTAPGYKDRRDAVRESWVKLIGTERSIKYYFVIGTQFGGNLVSEHLKKEQEDFKDIIIFPHIHDSYSTLSLKLLESLRWTHFSFNYKFVLKVDDDSFVRIDRLHEELMSKKADSRLYWGYFNGNAGVKRQGKWTEDNWFLCDKYLPYALGRGYVLSSSLVKYIVTNSHLLSLYHNEDVNMGVWLAPLNITRVHDPRFDTEYKSRGCANTFLVTHKQDPKEMRQKYNNLVQIGLLCKSQMMLRKPYFYNWKVAPSSCCFQNISLL